MDSTLHLRGRTPRLRHQEIDLPVLRLDLRRERFHFGLVRPSDPPPRFPAYGRLSDVTWKDVTPYDP